MDTDQITINLPSYIKEIAGELEEGYWKPQNLNEWTEFQKITVYLNTWTMQQKNERHLRKMIGIWIFILISLQVIGVFSLVFLDSIKWIVINIEITKFLIPSVLGEIFGMGFIVVKYLFKKTKIDLSELNI